MFSRLRTHRQSQLYRRRLIAALASGSLLVTMGGCAGQTPPAITTSAPASSSGGSAAPDPALAQHRTWSGTLATNRGPIGITLDGARAPKAVASFIHLARSGFFQNTQCHRLTTSGIFVLQCGDPTGTGRGGPGYEFGPVENAPADGMYRAGTLAMARRAEDGMSNGSQFFIVYADSNIPPDSAGGYTVLGRVTSGLDVVRNVAAGGLASNGIAPAIAISLQKVTVT